MLTIVMAVVSVAVAVWLIMTDSRSRKPHWGAVRWVLFIVAAAMFGWAVQRVFHGGLS
jgi:hypothetical protein